MSDTEDNNDQIILVESIYTYIGRLGVTELQYVYGLISLYSWMDIIDAGNIDENGICVDLKLLLEEFIINDKEDILINNMKSNVLSFNGTIVESVRFQTVILCRDEIAQNDKINKRLLVYDPNSKVFHITFVK
jgi:hypothetical protein